VTKERSLGLSKRKTWKCDFNNCNEIAEHYREVKRIIVKICLHHEVYMRKERMGKHLEFSQLSMDDILSLEEKEGKFEFECPNCKIRTVVPIEEIIDENKYPRCPTCGMLMYQV